MSLRAADRTKTWAPPSTANAHLAADLSEACLLLRGARAAHTAGRAAAVCDAFAARLAVGERKAVRDRLEFLRAAGYEVGLYTVVLVARLQYILVVEVLSGGRADVNAACKTHARELMTRAATTSLRHPSSPSRLRASRRSRTRQI